jgi:hypothetical protein
MLCVKPTKIFRNSLAPLLCLLTGCASVDRVATPSSISIETALEQVGVGLARMKVAEIREMKRAAKVLKTDPQKFNTGLLPSELSVTFNISRNAVKTNSLAVDLSGSSPGVPVGGKLSGSTSSGDVASRGNQIAIKFSSIVFQPTTTTTITSTVLSPEGVKTNTETVKVEQKITSPDLLKALYRAFEETGTTPTSTNPSQ